MDGRIDRLKEYIAKGYILLGVSNQSGVAKGVLTHEQAKACFDKTNELLGLDIDVSFCPHSVPPISCYCRKPGVGHGVEFIEKYKLDPALCIMVGDMTTDKTFSTRCGFKYVDQSIFFA
jgi:HAD superfamily hydrolase (TIGR01662 family)